MKSQNLMPLSNIRNMEPDDIEQAFIDNQGFIAMFDQSQLQRLERQFNGSWKFIFQTSNMGGFGKLICIPQTRENSRKIATKRISVLTRELGINDFGKASQIYNALNNRERRAYSTQVTTLVRTALYDNQAAELLLAKDPEEMVDDFEFKNWCRAYTGAEFVSKADRFVVLALLKAARQVLSERTKYVSPNRERAEDIEQVQDELPLETPSNEEEPINEVPSNGEESVDESPSNEEKPIVLGA